MTTMPKAAEISRNWYVIDAEGKPLGRVAAQAAVLLRGKHKTTFAPHVDCGDNVIIINCGKAVLTGKKLEKKFLRWHTGWIGHLKEVQYSTLMKTNPEKAMEVAVKRETVCTFTLVLNTCTLHRSPRNTSCNYRREAI